MGTGATELTLAQLAAYKYQNVNFVNVPGGSLLYTVVGHPNLVIVNLGELLNISSGEIQGDALAVDELTALQIGPGGVDTSELADGAVTGVKIDSDKAVGAFDLPAAVAVDHGAAGPVDLLAADPANDRLVLVFAVATEAATGAPEFDVGSEATDTNALFDDLGGGTWAKGDRFMGACLLPATEKLQCTINAAGTAGAFDMFTVVLVPMVQTAQIADLAVTTGKIANLGVTTGKIADDAVTGVKVDNEAVGHFDLPAAVSVDHGAGGPVDLLLADAINDRLVVVLGVATESAADGPEFDVGSEITDTDSVFDDLAAGAWAKGDRWMGACLLPAGEKLQCTINAAGTAGAVDFYAVPLIPMVQTAQIANLGVTTAKLDAGAVTDGKVAVGTLADDKLASYLVKNPGALANGVFRVTGVCLDTETVTIGTDVFTIDAITTDSADNTAGGVWNNIDDPLTVEMLAATYPVTGVGGVKPLVVGELIYIGTEYLRVTGIAGNNVTFERGACGSTPAAHANGADIFTSAATPAAPGVIPVGVQADFTDAVVTPKLAATINEDAGTANQSQDVTAVSLSAGKLMVIAADAVGATVLATTSTHSNGAWDDVTMRRGEAPAVQRVFRAVLVPDAEEVAADLILVPLPFAPSAVHIEVITTATGARVAWDGDIIINAAAAGFPDYLELNNDGAKDFTAAETFYILAVE